MCAMDQIFVVYCKVKIWSQFDSCGLGGFGNSDSKFGPFKNFQHPPLLGSVVSHDSKMLLASFQLRHLAAVNELLVVARTVRERLTKHGHLAELKWGPEASDKGWNSQLSITKSCTFRQVLATDADDSERGAYPSNLVHNPIICQTPHESFVSHRKCYKPRGDPFCKV